MNDTLYQLYINGKIIDTTTVRGIANLGFIGMMNRTETDNKWYNGDEIESLEMHEVYIGKNFDPILHQTIVHKWKPIKKAEDGYLITTVDNNLIEDTIAVTAELYEETIKGIEGKGLVITDIEKI